LFPSSISIELNHFNHGPSCASNKNAQGKKPYTSPSNARLSLIEKTNSPAKNFQPLKISSIPETNMHQNPTDIPPLLSLKHQVISPGTTNPHKKKRHHFTNPSNPHKKGHANPSFDHKISYAIDTSYPVETHDSLPNTGPPHTSHHFFKVARKGKKVALHSPSFTKSEDNDLPPSPHEDYFLELQWSF
jgi:hypothetical protein